MGKGKAEEMKFWTQEEFEIFIEYVKDKPVSYYCFLSRSKPPLVFLFPLPGIILIIEKDFPVPALFILILQSIIMEWHR